MIVKCMASALNIRSLPQADITSDTGKRMIKDQRAKAVGESFNEGWLYVDAPAGRGWCSKTYLTVDVDTSVGSPAWPKVPTGFNEITQIFGAPGTAICSAGRVTLIRGLKLGWSPDVITVFACHKLVEDVFTSFFRAIFVRGLWDSIQTFDGCYNPRTVTGTQKISVHAWGIGFDLNAATNRVGMVPQLDRRIVAIAKDHGLVWGGDWLKPDGMHLQRVKGY